MDKFLTEVVKFLEESGVTVTLDLDPTIEEIERIKKIQENTMKKIKTYKI